MKQYAVENGKIIQIDPGLQQSCSICRKYKDKVDNDDNDSPNLIQHRKRTNCNQCYHLSIENGDWDRVQQQAERQSENNIHLSSIVRRLNDYINGSVSVEYLIKVLTDLPKDSRVVITQSGYYSEGEVGEIFNNPEEVNDLPGIYVIGHGAG